MPEQARYFFRRHGTKYPSGRREGSVVSFLSIVKTLTKSGSKCRGLMVGIQMGNIPKAAHAKAGSPSAPFFCDHGSDRGRCRTHAMPQHHR